MESTPNDYTVDKPVPGAHVLVWHPILSDWVIGYADREGGFYEAVLGTIRPIIGARWWYHLPASPKVNS